MTDKSEVDAKFIAYCMAVKAERNKDLSASDIASMLCAQSSGTRAALWDNKSWQPTPEQIEIGLNDEKWGVRMEVWCRTDWTPNGSQIDRGLRDPVQDVRVQVAKVERQLLLVKNETDEGLPAAQINAL